MSEPLKILAWDIENSAHTGRHWGLFNQNIALSQLESPGEILSFAARWYGSTKKAIIYRDIRDGVDEMLDTAWHLIDEADALLSWNGAGFDTKKMNWAFALHGYPPPSPVKEIDLLKTARGKFKAASNKLEFISAQLLGESKVSHEGFKLWLAVEAGDEKAWRKFQRYNEQDVHLLIKLYDRMLPWINNHPNVGLYDGQGCPKCGSINLQKRGTRKTAIRTYQQFWCSDCGGWSSSGKSIEGTDIR